MRNTRILFVYILFLYTSDGYLEIIFINKLQTIYRNNNTVEGFHFL